MVEMTGFVKIFAAFGIPGLVIGIIYVMLYFFTERIGRVPPGDAAKVLIVVVLVTGGLTYLAIDRIFPETVAATGPGPVAKPAPDRDLRFQTKYVETKFFPLDADKVRADFTIRFVPTIKDNGMTATVFLGMAKFHDNAKVEDIDAFRRNDKKCADSPSCISMPVVWRGRQTVRGDTEGVDHEFSAVLDRRIKHVLVYWEFFQLEGDDGAKCEVDSTRVQLLDGLPYVRTVKDGKRIEDACYSAWQQKVVPVSISL